MNILKSHSQSSSEIVPLLYIILHAVLLSLLVTIWINNFAFAQEQQQPSTNTMGMKITSHTLWEKVPVGGLTISGTSTDNAATNCQVYVDVNDQKPFQNATATGPGGANDYSRWTFTYTDKYYLIHEGLNELTAKLSCNEDDSNNDAAEVTKYYSVNVIGLPPYGGN
jgi:hypothetical protein